MTASEPQMDMCLRSFMVSESQ